jgi:hypothetical protein
MNLKELEKHHYSNQAKRSNIGGDESSDSGRTWKKSRIPKRKLLRTL